MTISQESSAGAIPAFVPSEQTMTLPDGVALFFRAWVPQAPTDKALLLFHRGHEHSGRFQDVIEALDLNDVAVFAWDARGHGRSPGERGYAPSFSCLVKDMDCFVRYVSEKFHKPIENMVAMAPSVGAVTVAAWVHDYVLYVPQDRRVRKGKLSGEEHAGNVLLARLSRGATDRHAASPVTSFSQ